MGPRNRSTPARVVDAIRRDRFVADTTIRILALPGITDRGEMQGGGLDPTDCTDPERCLTISTATDDVFAGAPALAGDWRDGGHGHHPQGSS
jgi:hypothetical protein